MRLFRLLYISAAQILSHPPWQAQMAQLERICNLKYSWIGHYDKQNV
jgi:hypothetical protein